MLVHRAEKKKNIEVYLSPKFPKIWMLEHSLPSLFANSLIF